MDVRFRSFHPKSFYSLYEFYISLNTLLYSIPELENILLEIDEKFKPRYMFPSYDMSMSSIEEYNTHKGLSVSMIMASVLGLSSEWDIYAVMILYTLSIIVRYMPNLWTRINHGNLDRYKAVIYQFSRVAERAYTDLFGEAYRKKGSDSASTITYLNFVFLKSNIDTVLVKRNYNTSVYNLCDTCCIRDTSLIVRILTQ